MRSRSVWLSIALLNSVVPLAAGAQDMDVAGNVTMVNSTPSAGNILKDGTPFLHNFGSYNTFLGSNAGNFAMTGVANTASGFNALTSNTTGFDNTAHGVNALQLTTTGN